MWTLLQDTLLIKPLRIFRILENCIITGHGASFSRGKIKLMQMHCSVNDLGHSSHRTVHRHGFTDCLKTKYFPPLVYFAATSDTFRKVTCKISFFFFGKIFFKKQYSEVLNILVILMDTNLYVNKLFFWLVIKKFTKVSKKKGAIALKFVLFRNKYTPWLAL